MGKTAIEWTDLSSNPIRYRDASGRDVWACVKVSAGCKNCYAEASALRFGKGAAFSPQNMAGLTPYLREQEVRELLSRKKTPPGSKVFVGDMTDVFGEWVPFDLLDRLFAAFSVRPDVVFQVLTKRPERLAEYLAANDLGGRIYRVVSGWLDEGEKGTLGKRWHAVHELAGGATDPGGRAEWTHWRLPLPNVWLGTSVENQEAAAERIPHLLRVPARVRFLSCEPLLGPLDLNRWLYSGYDRAAMDTQFLTPLPGTEAAARWLAKVNWVILGGESGPGARLMNVEWVEDVLADCNQSGTACFVKQLGSHPYDPREADRHGDAHSDGPAADPSCRLSLSDRKGGDWEEWAGNLRVREMPFHLDDE